MRPLSLAKLIEQQTGEVDGRHPTAINGLTLYRRSEAQPPSAILYEPVLCLVAQGSKRILFGDKEYRYDAEHYLIVAADVPAVAQITEATPETPYLALTLSLDPREVSEMVAQLGPLPNAPTRALAVTTLDSALLGSVTRLLELLSVPQDAPVIAPLVRREIIYRILVGPEGRRLRQIVTGNEQGQRITEVMRWMKAHFEQPLRIDDLARQAGMSPSALHRHFKAVTALSPLQYQKHIRLQEARRFMLGEGLDAAEASFKVGYESPSQFSREYRRLFGAPPRRDIEALRQGAAPAVPLRVPGGRRGAQARIAS